MTMVNIPDEALQKAMRAAQTDSAEDVVVKALDEFSRQHGQASLIKHLGTFEQIISQEELREMREGD
ncbi:MAG TPA: hypothetical protein VIM11_27755 [Tepidisphaeraceae bacterium]